MNLSAELRMPGGCFPGPYGRRLCCREPNHHSDSDECTDGLKAAFLGVLGGNADHAFVSGRSPLALPHMPRNLTMALGRYTVANRPHPPRWTAPALAAGGHRSRNRW
jgi:hypothetical protein